MNNHEKNTHDGIAHLFEGNLQEEYFHKEDSAYELSNMQDSKLVYWYAFTTMKFASTSHAAKIKSESRSEEAIRNGGCTYISNHREILSCPTLKDRLVPQVS